MTHHAVHRLQVRYLVQVLCDLSGGVEQPEMGLVLGLEVNWSEVDESFDGFGDVSFSFGGVSLAVEIVGVGSSPPNDGHDLICLIASSDRLSNNS